eukprot:9465672-Pyramimonas_sp.AAC.1
MVGPWGWILPDDQRYKLVPGDLRAQTAFLDDFSEYVSRVLWERASQFHLGGGAEFGIDAF